MRKFVFAVLLLAASSSAMGASYDDLNAGIMFRNGDGWTSAIAQFDKAIAAKDLSQNQQFIAYLDRAQAHLFLQHFDQAISDYSASLALRPDDPETLMGRAEAYGDAGKFDQAVADLDALITLRPRLLPAHRMRATANLANGHHDKSVEDYKTILAMVPEDARRSRTLGIAAWLAGDYVQAEKSFSYAASEGGGDIYAWFWYVLTELRLGKSVPHRGVPDFDRKKWPAPVVGLYRGEMTPEALLAASDADANAPVSHGCETDFFVGEWLLLHHDAVGAKPLMQKAARLCTNGSLEWSSAQMDLEAPP